MGFVAAVFIGIVAFFHVWFFVLERYIWNMPLGQKIFKMSAERAEAGALLAANQGVYNLVLALGLIWTLVANDASQTTPVKIALLLTIIAVGVYGGITVGRNVFFMQVIPAVIALCTTVMALSEPKINDLTTSFDRPPQFRAIPASMPGMDFGYPAAFAGEQRDNYDEVQPVTLTLAAPQGFSIVERALVSFPEWKIVNKDPANFSIEGSITSQFFRLTDDFVVEVRPTGMGCEVHMRSRSRLGQSDFGSNAKHISRFLTKVNSLAKYPR